MTRGNVKSLGFDLKALLSSEEAFVGRRISCAGGDT
jgi:hypothetical protein